MSITSEPIAAAEQAIKQADNGVKQHYQNMLRRRLTWIGVIVAAILLSLIIDFTLGPSGLSLERLWQTLVTPETVDAGTRVIVWDIRLPYALMAVVIGMSLGLAGAEMQTILNNPLASPFTLGVSNAAAFGAALAIVSGIAIPGVPDQWVISANAFIFAFILCLTITLGQNYQAFLEDRIDWVGVTATYIGIPLFLAIWFGYKIARKTTFIRYKDMNFPSYKENLDK